MRKSLVGVILAFTLFLPSFVTAASSCSYSEQAELNSIAGNVKASYDVVDVYAGKAINPDLPGTPEEDIYKTGLRISIINITDDITIKIINNNTKEEKNYNVTDVNNGIITFDYDDINNVTSFTIEIYANKYSCVGELVRTFDFITPKYNFYSGLGVCDKYSEFYYCQEFLDSGEEISYDSFLNKIEELEQQEKEKKEKEKKGEKKGLIEKIKTFYSDNKIAINITGSIIVAGGIATTVILIKKRRSRVL